jgi:hypothetical protein
MAGLRREWNTLKQDLPKIPALDLPPLPRLESTWARLVESAAAQNRSVFTICSLVAISTVARAPANFWWLSRAIPIAARRTGQVVGEQLLNHYAQALEEMSRTGYVEYWRREFRPYLRAAAQQFIPATESSTERLLRRKSR